MNFKVMLHGTIRKDDFYSAGTQRSSVGTTNNVATMLQSGVALKIVVACNITFQFEFL